MASLTQWMWVWVNSGSWWWSGRPGVLWFMGSQRVRHDWAADLIWSELLFFLLLYFYIFIYFTKHHSDLLTLLLCPIGSCSCIYLLFLIYPLFYPGSISFIILSLFVESKQSQELLAVVTFGELDFQFLLYIFLQKSGIKDSFAIF